MRYSGLQIVFQEIPNEVSLALHVTGCPLKCKGCHSSDLWNSTTGTELAPDKLDELITKFSKYISCVVFMGGEWEVQALKKLIHVVQDHQKKCALYTGLEFQAVPEELLQELDYLKYGPYLQHLGGLNSKITNQKLINLKTNEVLNSFFTEDTNDSLNQ